jgi:hypothetical protein
MYWDTFWAMFFTNQSGHRASFYLKSPTETKTCSIMYLKKLLNSVRCTKKREAGTLVEI